MQIIKKKEKIGNILFTTAIILELLIMMTDYSAITLPLRGRIAQLAFVLFGCKILTTKYSKKQWIVIILLGILGCVSYFTCDEEYVLRAIVMVFAAKDIDLLKTVKIIWAGTLLGTLLIIGLSITGIMGELAEVRNFGRGLVETRWKFGFSHANNIHDILWYVTALFLLIKGKTCNWKHYVLITFLNVGLFFFTISRNGLLATEMLVLACAFFHYFPAFQEQEWPYCLGVAGLAACIVLTLLGGMYCAAHTEYLNTIDRLLTGRLEMVWEYAPASSWKWFPEARSLSYVDNGFASILFYYGILIGVGYWILILYMIYRFYREKNGIGLVILITTIFITFMESTFIFSVSLLCNPLYLLLFDNWYLFGKAQISEKIGA